MVKEVYETVEDKMSEVTTVGDITEEHYGWIVAVQDGDRVCPERDIYLINHRAWEYDGQFKVGLTDKEFERKSIRGTEYQYAATTPCRLIKRWKKPQRRKKGI